MPHTAEGGEAINSAAAATLASPIYSERRISISTEHAHLFSGQSPGRRDMYNGDVREPLVKLVLIRVENME